MKKLKYIVFICLVATAISSCEDGDKGISTIKIIKGSASSFYTNDPALAGGNYGVEYTTRAGTYNYSYVWGAYTYSGYYTIEQEKGETWNGLTNGILIKASDGKKRHYVFECDAAVGSELSWSHSPISSHKDIYIDKTFYFNGGKLIIKGKGVYDPNHLLQDTSSRIFTNK